MTGTANKYFLEGQVDFLNEEFKKLRKEIEIASIDNKKDNEKSVKETFNHLSGLYIKLDQLTVERLTAIVDSVNQKLKVISDLGEEVNKERSDNINSLFEFDKEIKRIERRINHDVKSDDSLLRKVKNLDLGESLAFIVDRFKDSEYERETLNLQERYKNNEDKESLIADLIDLTYKIDADENTKDFNTFKRKVNLRIEGVENQLSECKKQSDQYKIVSLEDKVNVLTIENDKLKKRLDRYEVQLDTLLDKISKD